jgi:hypothetical protein
MISKSNALFTLFMMASIMQKPDNSLVNRELFGSNLSNNHMVIHLSLNKQVCLQFFKKNVYCLLTMEST